MAGMQNLCEIHLMYFLKGEGALLLDIELRSPRVLWQTNTNNNLIGTLQKTRFFVLNAHVKIGAPYWQFIFRTLQNIIMIY